MGNPAKSEKKIVQPQVPDELKIFLKNLSVFSPMKSVTPLDRTKEESTRNGKREGTIVSAQSLNPTRTPSAQFFGKARRKTAVITHRIMQKIIFAVLLILYLFKSITLINIYCVCNF